MGHSRLQYIKLTEENNILTIHIDNPPNNFLPTQFFGELEYCIREIVPSNTIHAAIITGKDRVFSKGADIQEIMSSLKKIDFETVQYGNSVFSALASLRKPVVAAINGICLGGGFELALACHIRVCSEKALIGLPEVSAGVIPGLGGISRLIQSVGRAKALEMILLGDIIPASRALHLNIVSRIFPKLKFMEHVIQFVKTLLSARKEAIECTLEIFERAKSETDELINMEAARKFSQLVTH
ncbi:MAG: enoyl-CoA hydratase/isomerase family protein [Desulfatirhabdiaceae bacterium]